MSSKNSKIKGIQSLQKVLNYVEELSDKPSFQTDLAEFRESVGIPKKGFREKDIPSSGDIDIEYPKVWSAIHEDGFWESFREKRDRFFRKYTIPTGGGHIMKDYILYNIIKLPQTSGGLIKINTTYQLIEAFNESGKFDDQEYPILLQISPYAGVNDIKDFISGAFIPVIKPLQEQFKKKGVRLGKARKKDRNSASKKVRDLVYKHRNLTLKEIAKILKEKGYGNYNQSDVAKIKSTEKKIRA